MRQSIVLRNTVLVLSLCAVLTGLTAVTQAKVLPHKLKIEKVLDVTSELGDVVQSPRGELWLLERTTGIIRVVAGGVEVASTTLAVSGVCDSGLLDVAFAPEYGSTGQAFVSFVDTANDVRVDTITFDGIALNPGSTILALGNTAAGCRPGGGMVVGTDGKLYVGVGDLEVSANAPDDGSLSGKVLRVNLDGSVPVDNLSGTLVWAKGFRDGTDLAFNPGGTLYLADMGDGVVVEDEINAVVEGGDCGWDYVSGDSGGTYDDPLVSHVGPGVAPKGLVSLGGDKLGTLNQDSLIFTDSDLNGLQQILVSGPDLDQFTAEQDFYNPDGDPDGSPDASCPDGFDALLQSGDGMLYGTNTGDNPGLWRIWSDEPGPREVSTPGSPFPFTMGKSGGSIVFNWENLGALDVGRPSRAWGQHSETYQLWEGTLPFTSYDHTSLAYTDGTPSGTAMLTDIHSTNPGSHYYLISAQGDNLEGSNGNASDGSARSAETDYCDGNKGISTNDCIEDFRNPVDGTEHRLIDYNASSPTHLQAVNLSDYRGNVLKMDLSAVNCYWCDVMAGYHSVVDTDYRDRDMMFITVLVQDLFSLAPIAPANCASQIQIWARNHAERYPILCDTDLNGDGLGDITWQYWHSADCGGTPQNFLVDQGHVIYDFICGAIDSQQPYYDMVSDEINPETCE